ncbi:MAG TPA: hemolysin family protein [Candidatus Fournierella merdipullorum]|uniref:Hemolysin family protein n=1 Tax=Candidatus Allofournierella merdipullorum TaxID=2838595 RepID=A0A9D2E469_9FIRM|nr:hemolysin family protein [Candidatus Fournierella merdipullorum]
MDTTVYAAAAPAGAGIFAAGAAALVLVLLVGLAAGWAAAKRGVQLPGPLSRLLAKAGLGNTEQVTEEDLYEMVDDADEQDLIDENQKAMITNIFDLGEVTAGDIMTHRMDMVAVDETASCRSVIAAAVESGNSRLPVFRKTVDEIMGVLYVKDLLCLFDEPAALDGPVSRFVRKVMFVPESRPAGQLLLDFRRERTMIAIVVDEYGGTAGLVSMEDILEEIVGDIQDEYDDEEAELVAQGDGYAVDGAIDLSDVFEAFGMECPEMGEDEEFDTPGGLIIDKLGRIPEEGEKAAVEWGGLRFEVLKAGERRVQRVLCTRLPETGEEEQ